MKWISGLCRGRAMLSHVFTHVGSIFTVALAVAALFSGNVKAQVVEYYHTDSLGSPVAVTDQVRNVIQRSVYAPYGELTNRVVENEPGFAAHFTDSQTNLIYMQQRYYDPALGYFISSDPVSPYEDPLLNFNRYRYANGNPYRFVDLDGRQAGSSDDTNCSVWQCTIIIFPGRNDPDNTKREVAGDIQTLTSNIFGGLVDYTNLTGYAEVSGALGAGGTLSFSNKFKNGEQKLDLAGAFGSGLGAFAGVEADLLTFNFAGAKESAIFFNTGNLDVKIGEVIAVGGRAQFNPNGTITIKAFGGLGVGGKAMANKPFGIGGTLWSNKP